MVQQEGTIANIGTEEQVMFDFGEVIRPLALIDVDHPLIGDLDKWREVLLASIATAPVVFGDPRIQVEDAPGMVTTTLAFIAAMNRPMLIHRFQIYAGLTLTAVEIQTHVIEPQIRYDFDQLEQLTDDAVTIGLIRRYSTLCLAGELLPDGEVISQGVLDLFRGMDRPMLQERLHLHTSQLIAVEVLSDDDDDDPVQIVDNSSVAPVGGLPASLLNPPAPAV